MTDTLEATFQELLQELRHEDRLAPTHGDAFFTFVHDPAETLELHRRLGRFRSALETEGQNVEIHSFRDILWKVVDTSGRWDDWLEAECDQPAQYVSANRSMKDVLAREDGARPGVLSAVARLVEEPGRLVLLTDAGLLHPWFRADKFGNALHDRIRCPTVLFYPGRRRGLYGLRFLGLYPEDTGSSRTTILGPR